MGHDDTGTLLNLPISERGEQLVQTQEGQQFGHKSIRVDQKNFVKTIIGVVSTGGGTVVIGLSER